MTLPSQSLRADTRPETRLWSLWVRRERWVLSFRGWVVMVLGLGVAGLFVMRTLHPFLAVNHPVDAEYLVIEAWIAGYALEEGLKEFKAHPYREVLTLGGAKNALDDEADSTPAQSAANRLVTLGLSPTMVEAVRSPAVDRDRTYSCALGLRQWFQQHAPGVKAVNVMTVGPHARRTRLMLEKALGGKVSVGVIAIPARAYNPGRWWTTSEGAKEVISEAVAYLYARLLFVPRISNAL